MNDALNCVLAANGGMALVVLAGVHTGCFELFGTDRVRSVKDLKGKAVALPSLGASRQAFVASILKNVGLDPQKDVQWVVHPPAEAMRLLAEGKVDGWLGFPPEPQQLRARKIGHVLVDTRSDRPWSQYFCCMIAGNRDFVRKRPIATKKVVRAILKASELCVTEPERIARLMVDRGYASNDEYMVQLLKEVLVVGCIASVDHEPRDAFRLRHAELRGLQNGAHDLLGSNRALSHEVAVPGNHAAEVLGPWPVRPRVHEHMADLPGTELLGLGREAQPSIDLPLRQEPHRFRRGMHHPLDILLRVQAYVLQDASGESRAGAFKVRDHHGLPLQIPHRTNMVRPE